MKTIKYDDSMKIVCPVCKKVLLDDTGYEGTTTITPCKHLKLHYNETDGYIWTAKSPFKRAKDKDLDTLMKIAKENKLIVHKYDGGCLGGCCNAVDVIAFQP